MNSRIEELYKETIGKDWAYDFDPAMAEKFAELIIKDCVSVMSNTAKEANEKFTYMGDDVPTFVHQYKIKDHFGVK